MCVIALAARAVTAAEAPTYSQVHAVFAQRCMSCHDAKEAEGELVMETYESLMKGGEKGADIVPGKSEESRLVLEIEHRKKPFMPPPKKAEPLAAEEIAVIRAWIDAGAPGPKPGEVVAAPTTQPVAKIAPKVTPRRPVLSLAYEPKVKVLAAARPGEVEIWSAAQQAIIHRLSNLPGDVNAVVFSADGTKLLAAGGEPGVKGRVWIWNVADWTLVRTIEGHKDAIYSLAISADGKQFATGSYDQKITLWNLDDGKALRTFEGHNAAVFGVAFRPDGKVLASVSADRTLKLWDVATGKRLDTRPESSKELYALAFSPDGHRVAAGGVDNRIRIWQVSDSAVEGSNPLLVSQFAHEGTILRLAWSADGKTLLSSADDDTVKLFDAVNVSQKIALPAQPDWPSALAFALEDKAAAVGRLDGTIGFYDVASGKEVLPPKPELTRLPPRGLQRGVTTRLQLTGKNLGRLTDVQVSEPQVSAKLVGERGGESATVEITAAAGAPLAPCELTVSGPGGKSPPLKLFVEDIPQILSQKPNQTATQANSVSLPASVWGAFAKKGEDDFFAFDAKAGQHVVFDVAARRFGSKAQAQIALIDSTGKVLVTSIASADDPDPLLAWTAPTDGRYFVKVSDLQGDMGEDDFYRLSVGTFSYVTAVFPLAITANAESKVQLLGLNLPPAAMATVKAGGEGEADVPIDPSRYRSRRAMKVLVSAIPELTEIEPNDTPAQAMKIPVPGAVSGRIGSGSAEGMGGKSDADLYRFEAKAGQNYVIETLAVRRGSPTDTRIEVLHTDGKPVERVKLRAVRDSQITFRGFDANGGGARLFNWEEMQLNQYLFMQGEVVRLFLTPRGPDSEYNFYPSAATGRRCYFDTTATAHALDERVYIVEPHKPDETLAPNGLPVFTLNYENDDCADRTLGSDSRLLFTAPADGDYLVRVTDTRNFGGDFYTYRLVVRPAKPDFGVSVDNVDPALPPGAGRSFTVRLDRIDGFDGPVRVDVTDPPAGFRVSSPITIEAGDIEAKGTLYAMPGAAAPGDGPPMKLTATASPMGAPVTKPAGELRRPTMGGTPQVTVALEPYAEGGPTTRPAPAGPAEITVVPGKLVPAWLNVVRNGFGERVEFDVENLPHGVIVADIGLSGVLIPEGQTRRQIFLQCDAWVPETDRLCHARARQAGNPTSPPVMIHVRREGGQARTP
jgi:sugar lactone lactonase YvrE